MCIRDRKSIIEKLFDKWYIIAISTLIVMVSNSLNIFEFVLSYFDDSKIRMHSTVVFENDSIFNILILPFHPDKNCNIEDTDYEYQLLSRFEMLKEEKKLPVKILLEKSNLYPKNNEEAINIGKKARANIVIWGNFHEECGKEAKIKLNYVVNDATPMDKPKYWKSSLTDIKDVYDLKKGVLQDNIDYICLLYTSPSPRDATLSRMPSSA